MTAAPAVTAVVFDLGGVITDSPMAAFAAYEAEAGLPDGLVRRLNSTDPDTNAWARHERGELDAAGFRAAFEAEAAAAGHRVDAGRVLAALEWGGLRPEMVAAVRRLRDAGLPAEEMGLLLAADDLWADEIVLRIAERLGFAEQLTAAASA